MSFPRSHGEDRGGEQEEKKKVTEENLTTTTLTVGKKHIGILCNTIIEVQKTIEKYCFVHSCCCNTMS